MTHQNKFGMFIHWGIYAATGVQDQAFPRLRIPREEYESLMHSFNPVKYNPEEWVLLAKEAGMKYICFTTKHHDGFCMWDTKYTNYNIMNTPYGRDVLKMLADACQKHGMLLSLYYSNPDWHHPYGFNPASTHQDMAKTENIDTEIYREYVKNQVRELLTGYGPIYTFFWDIPPRIYDPSLNELVRELQPGILINNRGWSEGDFSTPEREYKGAPEEMYFTKMTEACNSVGEQSWGYRKNEDFYSIRHLTHAIDRLMAKGASYLLNVGPNAEGVITEEYASRIRRIGDWYNRMEGCLEEAEPDTNNYAIPANACIPTKKNGKTYLHFPDGIRSSSIALQYFISIPKSVRLMNTGKRLQASYDPLPEYYFAGGGGLAGKFLHITGIPIDDLENEPIVIEIEW